jgi:hypothetical protein
MNATLSRLSLRASVAPFQIRAPLISMPINPEDYNTYAVEKRKDTLSFFVNNNLTFQYPRIETDKVGQFPFNDQDFYLLIDMQLGGSWVGKVDPETLPVEMYIDRVRFYTTP